MRAHRSTLQSISKPLVSSPSTPETPRESKATARLRRAATATPRDRVWEGVRARLEWVEEMVAHGVPRDAAFIAEQRLQRALRLPVSRQYAAARRVGQWMHAQKLRAQARSH